MRKPGRHVVSVLLAALVGSALPAAAANLTRGPFLQQTAPDSVIVVWRTDGATDSLVRYGTDPASLTESKLTSPPVSRHEVRLVGLTPSTRYYYSIGSSAETFADGADLFFETAPPLGVRVPTRIWVLGDSGSPGPDVEAVRDAMISEITVSGDIDLWMMLGDNAYNDGLDSEFQAAVFDVFPGFLRNRPLWPTFGNHDAHSADSASQSGPYYDIFVLPKGAESGGTPSGTEAYYSFDFANVHFICLDSVDSPHESTDPMLEWALADAAATEQDWIIAFWHHPPYSKGGTDSDLQSISIDMRENVLPLLEAAGVDLVLAGHSHSYERSFLVNGAYDTPTTAAGHILDAGDGQADGDGAYVKAGDDGAVYVVAGSSSLLASGPFDHPLMYSSMAERGSLVVDVDGGRLDAFFLNRSGVKLDDFTIVKSVPPPTGSNHAPIAIGQSFAIDKDASLLFGLEATDPDGDPLTYSLAGPPANGTLSGSFPGATYTPDPGFVGLDTFTYKANDGQVDSNTATVSIRIGPFLDIHVIHEHDDAEERTSSGSVNLTSSDLELVEEGSNQTVGIRFQDIPIPRGADVLGAYVQFTVDEVSTPPTSLTIQGHAIGDSPAFASVAGNVTQRPRTSSSSAWDPPAWSTVGESGPDQRSTDISAVIEEIVGRSDWFPGNSLSLVITGAGKRVAEAYKGNAGIAPLLHVEWDDPGPQANQPPLASDLSVDAIVDTPVDMQLEATDPDGDPLTFAVVTSPTNGTLTGSAPDLTYTPDPGFVGADGFTFKANDGELDSNTATVSITVADPPAFFVFEARVTTGSDDAEERASGSVTTTSSDLELVRDSSLQTVGIRFQNVAIPQGSNILEAHLQFQVDEPSTESTSLTIRGHGADQSATFATQANDISARPTTLASASWSPPAWNTVGEAGAGQRSPDISTIIQEIVNRSGWIGGNALSIIMTGSGKRVAESFNGAALGAPLLHVEWNSAPQPNQPPIAEAQSVEAQSAIPLEITLAAFDPESAALTWEITSAPANGTLTGAAPDVTYTSDAGFEGADGFTFKVNDGELDSNEATVSITVVGAPDGTVFEARVGQSADDAEERASGSVSLTSSDLELVEDRSVQTVGIRFVDVAIPPGAVINSAYVQFQVDEVSTGPASLVLRGHDAGHSDAFVRQSGNLSQRTPTAASTAWAPPAWNSVGEAGDGQRTPDISAIIQEIVGRPDWTDGNALSLIVTGSGERVAESFNGDSAGAPLLHVEWE